MDKIYKCPKCKHNLINVNEVDPYEKIKDLESRLDEAENLEMTLHRNIQSAIAQCGEKDKKISQLEDALIEYDDFNFTYMPYCKVQAKHQKLIEEIKEKRDVGR